MQWTSVIVFTSGFEISLKISKSGTCRRTEAQNYVVKQTIKKSYECIEDASVSCIKAS